MTFYDLSQEQVEKMNVDYDFCACLEYNPQPFNLSDVDKVLAVIEGESDGEDWHWVVRLYENKYVYLRGSCDFTGCVCQSSADSIFLSKEKPLAVAVGELNRGDEDTADYVKELSRQLKEGKDKTWREQKDREFGIR